MPGDTLRLAYVGRLVEDAKRISLVARALDRVTSEIDGIEVTIYGDGPERSSVERILADTRTGRVRLAGHLPHERIHSELVNSHVIVLLSDYEGSPMAVMEGMACGCVPVCLSIRSGIPDLVEDGATGLLVEDRGESFTSAIRRLKNDRYLWQRLSIAAREKVVAEFSLDACAENWSQFIQTLCHESPAEQRLVFPNRIRLPNFDPVFAAEDRRLPFVGVNIANRISKSIVRSRMILGKIRRTLMGSPMMNDSSDING
jgi:glycosyltransferase involved in cell wall biosynthesis